MLRDDKFHNRCNTVLDYQESVNRHGGLLPGAELPDGDEMRWHMLNCYSAVTAAAGLMARRFGIYLPEFLETAIVKGKKKIVRPLMFPDLLFVCVRAIERQRTRILAVPGVSGIVRRLDGTAAVVPDAAIDRLQVIEMQRTINSGLLGSFDDVARPSKQASRFKRSRQERAWRKEREARRAERPIELRISPAGTIFEDEITRAASASEPEKRHALLWKALGLKTGNESLPMNPCNGDR